MGVFVGGFCASAYSSRSIRHTRPCGTRRNHRGGRRRDGPARLNVAVNLYRHCPATGGKTYIGDADRSRRRSTPHLGTPRARLPLSGPDDRFPEPLGLRPPCGCDFTMGACLQQTTGAAGLEPCGHSEHLNRVINQLDCDPLDRRLDNHGNGELSLPALLKRRTIAHSSARSTISRPRRQSDDS